MSKEKNNTERVVDLIKFEFEYIAIIGLIYGFFPIKSEIVPITQFLFIIPIFSITILAIIYLAVTILFPYITMKLVDEKLVQRNYKFLIYQVFIFIFAIFGYLSSRDANMSAFEYVSLTITYLFMFGIPIGFIIQKIVRCCKSKKEILTNQSEKND
jgi:hypothetical protein